MTKTELNRALCALRDVSRLPDPGQDVNVPITPRTMADVTEAQAARRMANRPPDAALNPVDAAFLGVEDRLRVVVDERNRLQQEVAGLYRALNLADEALDQERERTGVREVVLAAELRAEQAMKRRAVYTAALLFCVVCWRDGWWIAKWIWGAL